MIANVQTCTKFYWLLISGTISNLSPGSSVGNSEGNRMAGGAAVGANGRLPRKGRFLKGIFA